ncbi:MAG TPA: MBL fold metallo-hydrolase, partial [Acidobacteriota bacterium]|nr:MBL fold metallo-hydrolase [Acidobacteriota bacterium]
MRILTIPALTDNYIYILIDDASLDAAVVDPGDAGPVLNHVGGSGLRLKAILCTHHHGDHTGGIGKLREAFPGIPVYGGAGDRGRISA